MEDLQEMGISTRPATHAVHMLDFYKKKYNIASEDYWNSYAANNRSIRPFSRYERSRTAIYYRKVISSIKSNILG